MILNVVIPMAGDGSRFKDAGYKTSKPLIPVNGIPMITKTIKSLGLENANYTFITRWDDDIIPVLKSLVKKCNIIQISSSTEGPASTVLRASHIINNNDELIIANCDQIMEWNPEIFLLNARYRKYDGLIVTYYADTNKNSYAKVNKDGYVTEIKEKQIISNISLNGIHYWRRGSYFVKSAKEMIRLKDKSINGEYYVGPTYNYLIAEGKKIGVHHIPNEQHHAVGTPKDLERYIIHENLQIR